MSTKTPQLWVPITCLWLPHLRQQEYKWHSCFHSGSQPPRSCTSVLSPFFPPFPIAPQSLLLWPASHLIARKEADIPNFRYSPDLSAIICLEFAGFKIGIFSGSKSLKTPTSKKKKNNAKYHTFHFFLLVVFKWGLVSRSHIIQDPENQWEKYCLSCRRQHSCALLITAATPRE